MGLNKFAEALNDEQSLIEKEIRRSTESKASIKESKPEVKAPKAETIKKEMSNKTEEINTIEEASSQLAQVYEEKKETVVSKNKKATNPKNESSNPKKVSANGKALGRRPNSEKNIENRKQYSVTFRPSTYEEACRRAMEEDVPFAKYVERALLEYMKNH